MIGGEIFEGWFEIEDKASEPAENAKNTVGNDKKSGALVFDGVSFPLNTIKFLPPVKPSKIVCVGLNYRDHAEEFGKDIPEEPILFIKPDTAVIGHEDMIILPEQSSRVDYEGELAVIISKRCKNVSYEDAGDFILGYTCFNDVTARDLQAKDGQWTRAKSFDTFAPLGPFIVAPERVSPLNLKIQTTVNGKVVQSSNTSNLIFDVFRLIEFVSSIMTLRRGDVIATGTPSGVGPLKRGDCVEITIENIGTLRNHVI
jgi:2-keto-4-pentenoate hydratase/2-oxohepta-3-ene-1,7-dioic acid hydratase in catechol pathway